jgi:hypothetical protein
MNYSKSICLCFCLLLTGVSWATDSTLYKLKSGNYLVTGNKVPVYYSKGFENRAKELKNLFSDAGKFFKKQFRVDENYAVAVLNKPDWESLTRPPYQAYHASDSPHVIFIPAVFEDGPAMAITASNDEQVLSETTGKLRALGYSFNDAQKIMSDFRALHEAGHLIAEKLLISFFPGKPNKWYNEFLASYISYVFFASKRPQQTSVVKIMVAHTLKKNYTPKYSTLEDFESLYIRVGPQNYAWYQTKFLELVFTIFENKKAEFVKALQTSAFEKNKILIVRDLLGHLEKIQPGFIKWSEQFKKQ